MDTNLDPTPQLSGPGTPQAGFGVRLHGTTVPAARAAVQAALAEEGFGILTEIDVQATLEKKLGVHVAPYLILGACKPPLARMALEIDPYVGLFLPCNVTVWQEAETQDVIVTFANPTAMLGMVEDPRLERVAHEAERGLRGALERLVT